MERVYGYCPQCGLPGISRERRINGNDTCAQGHVYPSASAIQKGDGLKVAVTVDDLKKLERHLNAIEVANFDGTASMAQMVMAQHEALIRILDYLIGYANKERMNQELQDMTRPIGDACKQIIGEIEKIKEEIPMCPRKDGSCELPCRLAGEIARKNQIKALRWAKGEPWASIVAAIDRLKEGGELE